jgi:hypothetical protein
MAAVRGRWPSPGGPRSASISANNKNERWGGLAMHLGRSMAVAALVSMMVSSPVGVGAQPKPALDYGFYKNRVEPIFLKKKTGHTRCVVCHAEGNNAFKLEPLSAGARGFTEEQSRKNFEMVA